MLPFDIWYLVLDELAARGDGATLFNVAQANHTLAKMALPRLYRICYKVVVVWRRSHNWRGARLFRSIILSAEDKTAFPYCLWIETLCFWYLGTILHDITYSDGELYSSFFDGDMAPYEYNFLTPPSFDHSNATEVIGKAGETITRFVEKAVERGQHAVSLVGLQAREALSEVLPIWVARLPTLEQLQVSGSSSLSKEAASAIRDHCPRFRHLTIEAEFLDEMVLSSFLRTLRPECLEIFSAVGYNDLCDQALGALSGAHAKSLRRLELAVSPRALAHLGALRPCESLERLDLYARTVRWEDDNSREGALRQCQRDLVDKIFKRDEALNTGEFMPSWSTEHEASFAATASWLSACASLASLTLFGIPNSGELLRIVLRSPTVRLRCLHVDAPARCTGRDEACFLDSLRHQTMLEDFTFGWRDSGLTIPGDSTHALLMRSLCQCPQLRALKLIETVLTEKDLARLATSLPNLEVLMFDGYPYEDEFLEDAALTHLLAMPNLRRVCIDSLLRFTMEGLFDYIEAVAAQGRQLSSAFGYMILEDKDLLFKYAEELGVDFEISMC